MAPEWSRWEKSIEVRPGQHLNVLDTGGKKKPTVLLIHGFSGSILGWASQIEFLHNQGIRVIAPDLPGHGNSPYFSRKTVSDFSDDLASILKNLDAHSVNLVAHSYGSPLALELARQQPDLVRGLVVINGFRTHPELLKWKVRVGLLLRQLAGGSTEAQNLVFGDEPIPKVPQSFLETARKALKERIEFETNNNVYENPQQARAELRFAPPAEPNALINLFNATSTYVPPARLDLPIVVVHSMSDQIIPYKSATQFGRYPNVGIIGVDSSSHVLHRERQDLVNQAILDAVVGEPPQDFWKRHDGLK